MRSPRLLLATVVVLAPLAAACGSSTSTAAAPAPAATTPADAATVAATSSAPDPDATSAAPDPDATSATPGDADQPSAADSDADADADGDADPADATKTCDADALKADADAAAALPSGFPTVAGFTAISKVTQGSTVAVKGAVTGGPDDLPTVRDAGIKKLQAAGYKEGDHDQEAGAEADGDFTGPHNGNINVRNLCKGHLVVTYTLNN